MISLVLRNLLFVRGQIRFELVQCLPCPGDVGNVNLNKQDGTSSLS